MRIAIVDNVGSFSLFERLRATLSPSHYVFTIRDVSTDRGWSLFRDSEPDSVLVEFADSNAAIISRRLRELRKKPALIIRLHGYESHSVYLRRITWENVARLVAVSPWFERLLRQKLGKKVSIVRIENGVDLNKFRIRPEIEIDESAVAWVGHLNMKKGPALLRCVAASIPERMFHVGGRSQCENSGRILANSGIGNLILHGKIDPTKFLPGKRWILSTSVTESFSLAIAEGMASGLTPLVHSWPGADELWPEKNCWKSIDELRAIPPLDPVLCRRWVSERYSIDRCIREFAELLTSS